MALEEDQHVLDDIWTLYFHDPWDSDWSLSSYKRMGDIGSIEEFWEVHRELSGRPLTCGMFFLFRESVFPCWDDKHNIDGGTMSLKLLKADVEKHWVPLTCRMLGESLPADDKLHLSRTINGISISPKKSFCIVKIWLANDALGDRASIKIDEAYAGEFWYKQNREVITANQSSNAIAPSVRQT